jgi:hypothetical protein
MIEMGDDNWKCMECGLDLYEVEMVDHHLFCSGYPRYKFQGEDKVYHPIHYTTGTIEVIDFIQDKELDFCEGNIVKYICRWKHKGTGEQDLLKARQYIDFLLERHFGYEINR